MQAPNLLALQTESFDWLVGNERWRERMTAANKAHPGSLPETSGLEEIFDEISPIEDFGETMALSFHGRGVPGEGPHLLRPPLRGGGLRELLHR